MPGDDSDLDAHNSDDDYRLPGEGWSNGAIHPQLYHSTRSGRLELYSSHRRWIGLHRNWTRIGQGQDEFERRTSFSRLGGSIVANPEEEAKAVRALIAQLCERFYQEGFATGTGGGISIRVGGPDEKRPWRVFVAPSGVQKEDMIGEDIFELDMDRNVVTPPKTPNLRQSACTPLWYVVYKYRPNARAVIHTHSMHAQMATLLDPTERSSVLRITHLEMLKGVGYHAYDDILEIPIIDNRPSEDLLADQLERVIQEYPKCNAVLVRRHGVYVWGDSWEQAKTQCESFDYLFKSALHMKQLGIDCGALPPWGTYRVEEEGEPEAKRPKTETGFHGKAAVGNELDCQSNSVPILPRDAKILLLDIEGCTTSISFVKDVLFPYVTEHIADYVSAQYNDPGDYAKLCADLAAEMDAASLPTNGDVDRKDAVALVKYLVQNDVKAATLKTLQGQMWQTGYERGDFKSHVYSDFKPMLEWMKSKNVSVYIYSSGSIKAQKLLFGYSEAGDLLPFLSGHFDIPTAGGKKEASSYRNIASALKVKPSSIVFVSDAEAELVAAREAGIGWPVMSIRPGNAVLTSAGKAFPAVYSLLQLCGD